MESSLQKIIAAIVGIMILFIIPVYIAFEKADDVSYSLALKLTQNFVDNVRNKGYISPDMYSDFVSGLYATNNTYDVNIEHVKKRYDPAIYIYDTEDGATKGQLLHVLDYDRYIDDYENGSITIDVGIYNKVNSNIEIKEASITMKDGSYVKDKDGNDVTDVKSLYQNQIDQYRENGRIVVDCGEIYADVTKVTGSAFDEDIYIPSIIETFGGQIRIVNKQGTEPDTLPYETYKDAYYNSTNGIFWGPTYTEESINYVPALMRFKGINASPEESEKMYYERIYQYRSEQAGGDGRLVFDAGEIYADKEAVKAKKGIFDPKLDIEADITVKPGYITVKDGSVIEGYETDLQDYDKYISDYKAGNTLVEEGEIYTDENSDIEDIRGAIWKKGTALTEENMAAAEKLYNEQIYNYENNGRVVINKGEVYSTSEDATGYDSLTDKVSDISLNGTMTVNNPTGFQPNTLDFDKYINEYRENGDVVVVPQSWYYIHDWSSADGFIGTKDGRFKFIYENYEEAMLDDSDTITINFNYRWIDFGDVKPIIKIINKNTKEITMTKACMDGMEMAAIVANKYVTLGYNTRSVSGDVVVAGNTYEYKYESDYIIEISTPDFIILNDGVWDNDIYVSDKGEIEKYINEYIWHYNVGTGSYVTYSKVYNKSDIEFRPAYLDLYTRKNSGEFVYRIYRYQDPVAFDSISNSKMNFGITVSKEQISVEYTEINISEKGTITRTDENAAEFDKYFEDYYNNGRIVVEEPEVWEQDEVNVQHPTLTIYEKGTNNVLYEFSGKAGSKHEKYEQYVTEYRTKGSITIIPTREYTADDIVVTPTKIVITVSNEKQNKTLTFDDNHSMYENYLNQFETTGKIKLAEPEVYTLDDFEVQDPHIEIRLNGNKIIDIYEKDDKELYDEYKKQYMENKQITLKYDINDISASRASITIKTLSDMEDITSVERTQVIMDDNENYTKYLTEYNERGMITIGESLTYGADQLEVIDPSITITDPDTGSVIVKYEADYSQLSIADRYHIFESRYEEYDENHQIIDQKITYETGVNCIFEKAHVVNEEIITDKQIVAKLFKDTGVSKAEFLRQCMLGNGDMYNSLIYMNENSYIMNEGDQINVTVRNRNQTIASVFYSMLTANVGFEEIAKIYVDYGGTVKNDGETVLTEEVGIVTSETGRLFKYKGQAEEVILAPGLYEIECYGASGGYSDNLDETDLSEVGKGAYAKARFRFDEETTLYVYVGGQGAKYSDTNEANGGYNGGGNSYNGYGGGGATDVRLVRGDAQDTVSLLTRIITAAGAGGNSKTSTGYGGSGGKTDKGLNGKPEVSNYEGVGANVNDPDGIMIGYLNWLDMSQSPAVSRTIPETERGSFGVGGSVDFDGAGAGGGGYFGGSAAHDENAGGGGGLSYVYNGQKTYNDGIYYPLSSVVVSQYDDKVLDEILPYIEDGKWKGIVETLEINAIDGNNDMPNRLTYNGLDTMTGNSGNGYAVIKKIEE